MIDINALVGSLCQATQNVDLSDVQSIAARLKVDLANATVSKTKNGIMLINGARLEGYLSEIGIVVAPIPERALTIIFAPPKPPYQDIKGEIFGTGQRIERSKLGNGFAILFNIDHSSAWITISDPDGVIETISCKASA